MNKYGAILLLAAAVAGAQTKPPDQPPPEQLVYEFKNVSVNQAVAISNFVQKLMNDRVQIGVDGPFKTAILRRGARTPTKEDMIQAETLLQRYDVAPVPESPAPQVDFVAYLVRAANRTSGDATPPGQPIPAVLQDAIAEMKKTFAYSDYTLLDVVGTEVRHRAEVQNMFPGLNTGLRPYFYDLEYGDTYVSPDRKTVTVNPFKFTVRIPFRGDNDSQTQYQNAGITTDVAIQEGQKLVIGKVRTGFDAPADIFLVLTVRLH
jgi:hypothetical protein